MAGGADELLIGPGKSLADEQSRMNASRDIGSWSPPATMAATLVQPISVQR